MVKMGQGKRKHTRIHLLLMLSALAVILTSIYLVVEFGWKEIGKDMPPITASLVSGNATDGLATPDITDSSVPTEEISLSNSFSDAIITTQEGYELSEGVRIYYAYFPKGTALNNPEPLYVLMSGKFLRESPGFKVDGEALSFAPLPCSSASSSDFASHEFFNTKEAFDVSSSEYVCISSSSGSFTLKIASISEDSIKLVGE